MMCGGDFYLPTERGERGKLSPALYTPPCIYTPHITSTRENFAYTTTIYMANKHWPAMMCVTIQTCVHAYLPALPSLLFLLRWLFPQNLLGWAGPLGHQDLRLDTFH